LATISNTPRPGYVWDATDNVWYPIGVGGHGHTDYITQATAVNPTIIDAKGDILTATAADTPARLAVGNNGETLVADSSTSTGLRYTENYAAGKNKIINGDFGVWQRGTSFASPATAAFTSDRWSIVYDGTGATRTISQQTFTPGTAPVAGYEGRYFYRFAQSVAGSGGSYNLFQNRMEQVQTFAGQTVTISFWGKAAASTTIVKLNLEQDFGSGGSPSAAVSTDIASTNFTLTTSWQRFSVTTTVPSISGKTIGTTTPGYLGLRIWIPVNSTFTIDIWGVQVEDGSVATAFQTATGTIQGELAACQRYFYLHASTTANRAIGMGCYTSSTAAIVGFNLPVTMRVIPTATVASGTDYYKLDKTPTEDWVNDFSLASVSTNRYVMLTNSTQASGTAGGGFPVFTDNANSSMSFSAEL